MPLDAAGNEVTGNDLLDQAAQAQFAHVIDPENNPDPELDPNASPTGGEGAGSDPSGSVGSDPNLSGDDPPIDESFSWDDGYKLTKAQARSYAELEAYLYANPEKAEALRRFLGDGGASDDPTKGASVKESNDGVRGEQSAIPEINVDEITDPDVRAVVLENRRIIAEMEQLRQEHSGVVGYVTTQQEQNAESIMNRATTSFKEQHTLSDEDMAKISNVAARLNILPSLMSPVDPITGMSRNVDPLAAIEEALDTAYWQIPEFRARAISNEMESQTKSKVRKGKLSSLQGGSGSVPREQPVSETQQGRRDQMIAEVAQMIGRE